MSESFVKRYWPDEQPIGRHFTFGLHDREVVGVVSDIHVRGLEQTSEPQVYLPYKQVPDGWLIGYVPKDLVSPLIAVAWRILCPRCGESSPTPIRNSLSRTYAPWSRLWRAKPSRARYKCASDHVHCAGHSARRIGNLRTSVVYRFAAAAGVWYSHGLGSGPGKHL